MTGTASTLETSDDLARDTARHSIREATRDADRETAVSKDAATAVSTDWQSERPAVRANWRRPSLGRRTVVCAALTASVLVPCAVVARELDDRLADVGFATGWLLLGLVVFLAAYNLRKRFAALPLLRSTSWLQAHLAAGFVAIGVYGLHVGPRIPDGWFERLVAGLFVGTAASGLYGLYASRAIPRKLTGLRVEAIFERIPQLRERIADEATRLAIASLEESTVLATAVEQSIGPFLSAPRSPLYYLFPTGARRRRLVSELRELHRYLAPSQREQCRNLELLVCEKDDLDYHAALQGRLKLWLFVHIGLTYSLLSAAVWHAVLAHAFYGGHR